MKHCENCNTEITIKYGSGRFCPNKCAKGFSTKKLRNEINLKVASKLKGTGQPDVEIICKHCSTLFKVKYNFRDQIFCSRSCRSKGMSIETRNKLSEIAKNNNFGGNTSKVSIYFKKANGEVVYLQSKYELLVAEELERNNINWERPKYLIWIDLENKNHKYYGDFYLKDFGVYLDPKNDYLIKKDLIKIESVQNQNNVIIIVLNKNQLTWEKISTLVGNRTHVAAL